MGEIDQYQGALKKTQKVKVNAQGYSHLPTHLMASIDRYDNYLSKKLSLGTQFFIFCQIWQMKKQYYEKVNKFWLVSYEIEQAPTYEKSHSVAQPTSTGQKILSLAFFVAMVKVSVKAFEGLERENAYISATKPFIKILSTLFTIQLLISISATPKMLNK